MTHSVIIPLYNKAAYIANTLKSLSQQELLPYEIIIVDDASTDQSLAEAKIALQQLAPAFNHTIIKIIEQGVNRGPGQARNTGIEHATGEIISFLDADDCYAPFALARIHEAMTSFGFEMLILGIRLEPSGEEYPSVPHFAKQLIHLDNALFRMTLPLHTVSDPEFIMGLGSNVAVRRKWLNHLRFDTDARLNEGIDFWYRVLKQLVRHASDRTGLLALPCIFVCEVEGSLSRRYYKHWRDLEVPLPVQRLRNSRDRYDLRLMSMITFRWLEHAMERLPDFRQKCLFVLGNAGLLLRSWLIRSTKSLPV